MIPILYEKDEVSFTSNGLGRLRDCISCECSEERNGIYECDFEYPTDGANFDAIQIGRIIGVTHDDRGDIQPFDIVSYSKPINGIVKFHCVHISYRQNYLTVNTTGLVPSSLSEALGFLKSNAEPVNPFFYQTDKTNAIGCPCFDGTPRTVKQMLGGVEGSILDTYNGEYEWDRWSVILHNARGQVRDFGIRYGVNMTEYNDDTDSSGSYMSCIPYWQSGDDRVIGDKVDSTGVTAGNHGECVPLDISDKFESKPTKAQVEAKASEVMEDNNPYLPTQNIKVSFVRLQDLGYEELSNLMRCSLCDTIKVYFAEYGMSGSFKIVKTVWDVLSDRYKEMELGALSTTLSEALGIQTTLSTSGGGGGAVTGVKGDAEGAYRQGDVNLTCADIGAEPDITSTTALTVGSLKISDHSTAIGATLSARNTSTVTVNTSTATNICSLSLPKGTWVVACGLKYPANTTGYRAGKLSSTSANVSTTNADVITFAQNMGSTAYQMQWTKIVAVTSTSQTWYLEAIQNSGSNLVMPTGSTQTGTNPYGSYIHAVRIA